MSEDPIQLGDTAQPMPQAPIALFWASVVSTILAGGTGVACLVAYWLTERDNVAFFGLMWLFFGGLLTFGGFVCGLTYANRSREVRSQSASSRHRARLALILPVLNVFLAVGCAWLGSWLVSRPPLATFSIHNRSDAKIESGKVLFGSMTIPFGAIAAQSVDEQETRVTDYGKMTIEFSRGGTVSNFELLDWSDEDVFWQRPLRIFIEIDDVGATLRD